MKNTTKLLAVALLGISLSASAQTAAPRSEVGQRQQNQKARIQAGEQNGQITKAQGHALNQERKSIGNEAKADRAQNGGKLTPVEKKQINHQQNQVSRQIHNEKHPNNPK
jgi:hypothetical protein